MIARTALVALALVGCSKGPPWEGTFDIPEASAVLQDGVGGPFTDPIAYVASTDGGQIALLDLRKGIYLADQATGSFVRGAALATGHDRVISSLAAYAPDDSTVDLFVADRAFRSVLRVPHIVGRDDGGGPLRREPTATRGEFVDVDGSGDSVTIGGVVTRLGYTSTEDWSFEFDGQVWNARGSRSGRQAQVAIPNIPWLADRGALELTIFGRPTWGDRVEIHTDSGIEEYDVGGVPMAIAMSPDQRWLAVSVTDPEAEQGFLRIVDPATGSVVAEADLPYDAEPGRLTWMPDGATLYATDYRVPAVWGVAFDASGPSTVTRHDLPWTVFDVAALRQPDGSDLLYVAPTDGREVWLYDTGVGGLIDFNPMQSGVGGLDFDTLVQGVEALPLEYEYPQSDNDGIRPWGRSVAVSLYNGSVVFMSDVDGCLVGDPLGPRTVIGQQSTGNNDYTTNYSPDGGPFLEYNGANDRSVIVNRCGGVAKAEAWTVTYRRDLQAWEVEGSRSGIQQRLAYDDRRYISDTGAVSFTIRGGVLAAEDGWRISFAVLQGVVMATSDVDGDGAKDVEFDLPGDPTFFHHDTVEQREDGWMEVRESPFVLVPASSADLATRIDPRDGRIQVSWW